MPVFEQHGKYRLERDGFILKLDASGQVNDETILAYTQEVLDAVQEFGGEPFAIYSRYDGQVLLTHEAESRLRDNIAERVAAGMCAAALNLNNSDYRLIVAAQIGGLYEEMGVPWREFEKYEDAKSWLEAHIADARQRASG
ncbi:ribonuclease E inhibitor RraB [Nisaea acidiphila]|uniref:Ribonuclease E inhibitor RraB n=1 Tax=Nisaea acidiphila TaxID=1862145 RepID=A0A9J7ANS5_9PROT|nr:ribonuclease E inhibitor RraB [Nisaea acidiphila]UUX48249.1 ribonuclease E inhibitor RraB [Nisaea acidiphila]